MALHPDSIQAEECSQKPPSPPSPSSTSPPSVPTQLATAASIFDDTCQLPLKPLHELAIDENRKLIDRRFYGEVLGIPADILKDGGPLDTLRKKLSREPSIRGSK